MGYGFYTPVLGYGGRKGDIGGRTMPYLSPRTKNITNTGTPTSLSDTARSAFTSAEESLQPGGGYGAGVKAALDRTRKKYMASGQQSLISAGLANTTMGAGLSGKFAEEVAAPALANVEGERARLIANLKLALANAEQGATESAAGRSLQSAQLGAQTGLGYAQLGASQKAQQGQLGLGYAQLGSQERLAMARLQASMSGTGAEARTTNPGRVGTLSFI